MRDKGGPVLFLFVSLGLYVLLVFDRLTAFPVYFFCDEAVEGVDAKAILATGADMFGHRHPLFFCGLGDYALSLSVYLHVPFIYVFGLNELSVRLATACSSLLGVGAVYLLARHVFAVKPAWATFLLFATSPIWFLHSRTGFEYVIATSFFLAFALFYVLAFERHPLFVAPAALAAGAAFYSYTPARGWIAVAVVLLGVVNLPVHLRRWRTTLAGLALFAVCLAPSLYVQWVRPDIMMKRLEALGFADFRRKPAAEQLRQVAANYAAGLDPRFWYTWKGTQKAGPMGRHVIPPLPQLPVWTAPFALIGFLGILWSFRRLESRTLVALLLASLFPASLVGFNNARAMPVGPLLLLFSLIGAGQLWSLLERRPWLERIAQAAALAALVAHALLFRRYVFDVAPYAYADYGFNGVQMGAAPVFHWIAEHHSAYDHIRISEASFNSTSIFVPFYLEGEAARKTSIVDMSFVCSTFTPLPPRTLYVVPVAVFRELRGLGCPIRKQLVAVIPDLRGEPLFEMMTLEREPGFADWIRHEDQRRRELERSTIGRGGARLEVEHSAFDIGDASAMFDGNRSTLARSARINPARVVVHLPGVTLRRVSIAVSHTGSEEIALRTRSGEAVHDWGMQRFGGSHGEPVELDFVAPEPVVGVNTIEIDFHVTDMDRNGYVHINEIDWR